MSHLINSATNQAWIQGFELAHTKIYLICEPTEHVKGTGPVDPKLQALHDEEQQKVIQTEDLMLMVQQKPERAFANKDAWAKGCTVGLTVTHCSSHNEMFAVLCFMFIFVFFCFGG